MSRRCRFLIFSKHKFLVTISLREYFCGQSASMLQEVISYSVLVIIMASYKVAGENGKFWSNTFVKLNYAQNYSGKIIQSSPWKTRQECATRSVLIYRKPLKSYTKSVMERSIQVQN